MFGNQTLVNYLQKASSIDVKPIILAEWNMNIAENFDAIGNYRYRKTSNSIYSTLPSTYDRYDQGNYYTGATQSDVTLDNGYDDSNQPQQFTSVDENMKNLFSLEECFGKYRPRSGINKARLTKFWGYSSKDVASRPRYYVATRKDKFKYWTSYRYESGLAKGISYSLPAGGYGIDDACPFIVYKDSVPTNRIVVKMQTHVGSKNNGPFYSSTGSQFSDPFFGYQNSQTPATWRIQYLEDSVWKDAISFSSTDVRSGNRPIIGPDGNVEIAYGLKVPNNFKNTFNFKRIIKTVEMLPNNDVVGSAYLFKPTETSKGILYIFNGSAFIGYDAQYEWSLLDGVVDYRNVVDKLSNPDYFINTLTGLRQYEKFVNIYGLRVVVETMNTDGSSFDLIEMSPRLVADMTDMVTDYSVTKSLSDLGASGMPVGQLLAGTGSVKLFDYNQTFNENNPASVIKNFIRQNIKFMFYEQMSDNNGNQYMIPIKTLYSSTRPAISGGNRDVSIELRDLTHLMEQTSCPELMMVDVSFSVAVTTLLDSIGFTNYKFYRTSGETEITIPYFYTNPESSVLQTLQDLAISAQAAMFFNEENDFIIMSKNYMMPTTAQRPTDFILSGEKTDAISANIESISTQDSKVFNNGSISYQEKYIQRSYGSLKQAMLLDRNKTWIYKPVLLWEAAGDQNTKTQTGQISNASNYTLSAVPLNSALSSQLPEVVGGQIRNNTMDLGEGVYFLSRYNGYFYANGEVIRYDAVQYSIPNGPGNVWIQSAQEYSDYFQDVKFAKSMFPTGLVRIYCEPFYEEVNGVTVFKNGPVNKHGRMQFNTGQRNSAGVLEPVTHNAGLALEWSSQSVNPTRGCKVSLNTTLNFDPKNAKTASVAAQVGNAGVANSTVSSALRAGIIKNSMGGTDKTDAQVAALQNTEIGTVQSSALVMTGPTFASDIMAQDYISYVPKTLSQVYAHYGTRLRIIGQYEDGKQKKQSPTGSMGYYDNGKTGGASAGIAVLLNKETNNGYYFELCALTNDSVTNTTTDPDTGEVTSTNVVFNDVIFYKIKSDGSGNAVPIKLWGGIANILVDTGMFVGQSRVYGEDNPTIYDLSVEHETLGNGSKRFYLYINNRSVAVVDDENPLPEYTSFAPFIRGTSKAMFENVYALKKRTIDDSTASLSTPVQSSIFGINNVSADDALRKYSLSGAIQQTYLSDISSGSGAGHDIYFDEFGTIMREAAYFNIKYDKAWPALNAKIAPTFTRQKGYTVSGFTPTAYGADFIVFNNTDTVISLDETTGNYLRIQGVTFTQNSDRKLTVDDFFSLNSDLSNVDQLNKNPLKSPVKASKTSYSIKASRKSYGNLEFSINAKYIQNAAAANSLMEWMINKVMKPRKSVGVSVFGGGVLQLGDIVQIFWTENDVDQIVDRNKRFVVYSCEYQRGVDGPSSIIYLSEVTE
jgi:hypothetical protein